MVYLRNQRRSFQPSEEMLSQEKAPRMGEEGGGTLATGGSIESFLQPIRPGFGATKSELEVEVAVWSEIDSRMKNAEAIGEIRILVQGRSPSFVT